MGVRSTPGCNNPDAILPKHPATNAPGSRNVKLLRKPSDARIGRFSSTISAPCPSPTPRWAPRATEHVRAALELSALAEAANLSAHEEHPVRSGELP